MSAHAHPSATLLERFFSYVDVGQDGCWRFRTVNNRGYGIFSGECAHRIARARRAPAATSEEAARALIVGMLGPRQQLLPAKASRMAKAVGSVRARRSA